MTKATKQVEYAAFDTTKATPKEASAWLKQTAAVDLPPPNCTMIDVARNVVEAQAVAGVEFQPVIVEPPGLVADQQRWYDVVRERAGNGNG